MQVPSLLFARFEVRRCSERAGTSHSQLKMVRRSKKVKNEIGGGGRGAFGLKTET